MEGILQELLDLAKLYIGLTVILPCAGAVLMTLAVLVIAWKAQDK